MGVAPGDYESDGPTRGFDPTDRVRGTLRPPGSKSIAQRALLLAGAPGGRGACLRGLPEGDDVRACVQVVRALGARLAPCPTVLGRALEVVPGSAPTGVRELRVGESGTLARLTLALAGLAEQPGPYRIHAAGSLRARRSPALLAALRAVGARVEPDAEGAGWPLTVSPAPGPLPKELVLDHPSSSQELSALWLALALRGGGGTRVRVRGPVPSTPYLRLTRAVLFRFGAEVCGGDEDATVRCAETGGRRELEIEPDASSAAVALAAGALSGGSVRVQGIGADSVQGDREIVRYLAAFGCRVESRAASLEVTGTPTRGAQLDLAGTPDLAPVLAPVAALVALRHGQGTTLRGLGTLPGKESDRLAVLVEFLTAVGVEARASGAELHIGPGAREVAGSVTLDPRGDHRMAFAAALLGLLREGVRCAQPACVAKSWPAFWEDLRRLGAGAGAR